MNSTITDEGRKEAIATAIAPLAWAALGAGDTLAHLNRRKASLRHAEDALMAIEASGLALVPATDASELLAAREALKAARSYVEAYDTVGMNDEQTRVLELIDRALSGKRSGKC